MSETSVCEKNPCRVCDRGLEEGQESFYQETLRGMLNTTLSNFEGDTRKPLTPLQKEMLRGKIDYLSRMVEDYLKEESKKTEKARIS